MQALKASAKAFIDDILAVYDKHGLALSHEDGQGGFEIVEADQHHIDWLCDAEDCRREAEAIRWQCYAAAYHTTYERSRDDSAMPGWAVRNHSDNAAQAFMRSWRLRFGTHSPEAWS